MNITLLLTRHAIPLSTPALIILSSVYSITWLQLALTALMVYGSINFLYRKLKFNINVHNSLRLRAYEGLSVLTLALCEWWIPLVFNAIYLIALWVNCYQSNLIEE